MRTQQQTRRTTQRVDRRPRTIPRTAVRITPEVRPTPTERPTPPVRPAAVRRPPRAPFVLLIVGLMCGGLITLLLLNTVLAQGSFKENDLRASIEELREQAASQENQLRMWGQPGALSEAAKPYGAERDDTPPRFIMNSSDADGVGNDVRDTVR